MLKKRITWGISFILVFLIGDRAASFLLHQSVEHSQFRYSRLYTDRAKADILLVGNSRGLDFFQPHVEALSERSTFNVSYNGMTMDVANVLIQDYLDRSPETEVMLIDVTLCDRVSAPFVTSFAPYFSYSERLRKLIKATDLSSYYAMRLSHLYRYNNEVFQRILYYQTESDESWLLNRDITTALVNKVEDQHYQIDPRLLADLKSSVSYAKQKGVRVHLVINPYYVPFAKVLKGLDDFKAAVEAETGQAVLDFSEAIEPNIYFGDYQHLNQAGSRVYMQLLYEKGLFEVGK